MMVAAALTGHNVTLPECHLSSCVVLLVLLFHFEGDVDIVIVFK
jgi:hypothetical protein